ncbi:ribosome maturation factor RimP [Georgenia faecalis]|uniref:Ribosome maturation factor RimP n=1 Tax=Georgenia faecalis TaxID=2483799 RepID=A0ABV9DBJ8_9MICO|nr:ribosome maturation factor RimP [Georgenia faecalis]
MGAARSSEVTTRLRAALEPVVAEAALLLEDVTASPAGRRSVVRVVVDLPDGPGGVDSDALAEVSRRISEVLDDVDLLQGAYTLEVSTPGIDRPLTDPRHFRRATGRLVRCATPAGPRAGRLVDTDADGVWLEHDGAREHIDYAGITGAKVEPELRPARDEDGLEDEA